MVKPCGRRRSRLGSSRRSKIEQKKAPKVLNSAQEELAGIDDVYVRNIEFQFDLPVI